VTLFGVVGDGDCRQAKSKARKNKNGLRQETVFCPGKSLSAARGLEEMTELGFCARSVENSGAQQPDFVTGVITPLLSIMNLAGGGLRLLFRNMNFL
jgi:hypothetical protein